ncbi:hypothetical protein PFNF135_06272 [Plasmodium falciparum NF135/5.C10]|uniref:Surface antigen n=1 Tax=Plasmodium falciparum NF135/5.C10 TaxID=1036726 RepID=W4I8I6_PLAFA|nr:hypothetical protein PFNF135_06272 [Plasmodium falciparum NF135/5.C10]
MKILYTDILLFALPLNILEHNQRNHNSTIYHTSNTKPIKPYRSLCECELFAPQNYDNDPEMKRVMQQFHDRTTQRFQEYDERLQERRQICKDKCDKEIQKIILKDKIEKELAETFSSLHTDIQSDAIPTCICEKSVTDKFEKTCLKCGNNMGGLVPGLALIGGNVVYSAAVNAATKAGMDAAILELKSIIGLTTLLKEKFAQLVTTTNFQCPNALVGAVQNVKNTYCVSEAITKQPFCLFSLSDVSNPLWFAQRARDAAQEGLTAYGTKFVAETSPNAFLTNPYIASSIAIMIIVAIVLTIYLILSYRRKKKMKKKLQYIKLLKE